MLLAVDGLRPIGDLPALSPKRKDAGVVLEADIGKGNRRHPIGPGGLKDPKNALLLCMGVFPVGL